MALMAMEYASFFSLVKRKWISMLLAGFLAGSVSFFAFIFFSKPFKVTTDFLVVQTGAGQSQDFYSMLKSSEYLGKVLSQSIGSEKFIGAVVETGGVDGNFLPQNPKDRLESWEKMVKVSSNPDVGSLHIAVYGKSDRDALRVSQAVGKVLIEKNALFRSGDEKSIEIRTLSGPIVEKNPEIQYLVLISISGFIFGASLFILFVFLKFEAKSKEIFLFEEKPLGSGKKSQEAGEVKGPEQPGQAINANNGNGIEKPESATAYLGDRLIFEKE